MPTTENTTKVEPKSALILHFRFIAIGGILNYSIQRENKKPDDPALKTTETANLSGYITIKRDHEQCDRRRFEDTNVCQEWHSSQSRRSGGNC